MVILTINLQNSASPKLRALAGSLPSAGLMTEVGRRLNRDLRDYFTLRERSNPRTKGSHADRGGWHRQHWWEREVVRNTAFTGATATESSVTIASRPFRLRLMGGIIRPVEKEALTIPMRDEAYGITPGSGLIANLFLLKRKGSGKAYLARREGGALRLFYRLVKWSRVFKDPEALPKTDALAKGVQDAGQKWLDRKARDTGGAS